MEAQRYPISIRLIGMMHKEKNKLYMASVLWSDQNDIVVYRSFKDFKKVHKQMKKAFPPANPLKKSDRIIPRFRDQRMKRRTKRNGPTKSVVRLKFLEQYCSELLSCDPRVSHSAELIQFFQPQDQDLQPDFAKNSIMVMPSDDVSAGSERHATVGNVTQPFVTETYVCVAPYETKDTKNKPFKVSMNEKVDVLIKDNAGWWLVENEAKHLAWFPAPYLEKLDDEEYDDDMDGHHGTGLLYRAVKSYKATKGDEVSVGIGSVVEVLQKSNNGWWLIRTNGKAGYIPVMYLKPYNSPHIQMAALQQDLRNSTLNLSQLQLPSAPGPSHPSREISRSQGDLLQLPGASPPSAPGQLQLADKLRSRSMNALFESRPALPAVTAPPSSAENDTTTDVVKHAATPTITVELDGEEDTRGRSPTVDSEESLGTDSDFSFSDGPSSSLDGSMLNLSDGLAEEQLRLSRTPPPMSSSHLSPDRSTGAKLNTSVSEPTLFKKPAVPKVPPRPRAQEILTRCSTVTRKNAAKIGLPLAHVQIASC
ncbi:NADPH oxidase organizer 1a [Lampris incognitus]|uniref:NADPH oxidase organizer 1a n=1 Tax=Lampris incognitus TaxID=2546036 RepID=UPI0024B55A31|nr:NADPH oxidase organizer 1a [Lampris incognitus]